MIFLEPCRFLPLKKPSLGNLSTIKTDYWSFVYIFGVFFLQIGKMYMAFADVREWGGGELTDNLNISNFLKSFFSRLL